jgi:hypothetical protein
MTERRAAQIVGASNRGQNLLALEGAEFAQRSVSLWFYVTLP